MSVRRGYPALACLVSVAGTLIRPSRSATSKVHLSRDHEAIQPSGSKDQGAAYAELVKSRAVATANMETRSRIFNSLCRTGKLRDDDFGGDSLTRSYRSMVALFAPVVEGLR
jgi:hypothetical protein